MSEGLVLPETNEEKIVFIVNTLRESVFEALDLKKEELMNEKNSDYKDSNWTYDTCWSEWYWSLGQCNYTYLTSHAFATYKPFYAPNYDENSLEWKLVENLCDECRDSTDAKNYSTIAKAVMARLLTEWRQKEDAAYRKEQIKQQGQSIREHLDEYKVLADTCGISIETVLLVELKKELHTLSKEFRLFREDTVEGYESASYDK